MKFGDFIKDRKISIIIYAILCVLVILFLNAFKAEIQVIIIVLILFMLFGIGLLFYSFFRRRHFYNKLLSDFNELDRKYLISSMLGNPSFFEGEILKEIIYYCNKDMNENVNRYKMLLRDFREFIEMWVHEIKAPITSSLLSIHNKKNEDEVIDDLKRIEYYVEQVLYYSKIDNVEDDYNIKEVKLKEVVNKVIKENKKLILSKNLNVDLNSLDYSVLSDSKWLEFIVNQIINNSIKYSGNGGEIVVSSSVSHGNILLSIKDNGIGINESDIKKVFNKGFTGINGRQISSSTGMGLFIVKKLCNKLKHKVFIKSILGKYTEVSILFVKNDYFRVVK